MGDNSMIDKRRIEFTEDVKLGDIGNFEPGDIKNLAKEVADMCVNAGWAKDCETGETGERKPGAHRVAVSPVVQRTGKAK